MQFSTPKDAELFDQAIQDGLTKMWQNSGTYLTRERWLEEQMEGMKEYAASLPVDPKG